MTTLPLALSLLLLSCADDTGSPGDGSSDGGADDGGATDGGATDAGNPDDTGAGITWQSLPADCTPPAAGTTDPFTLVGAVTNSQGGPGGWFVELLDVHLLPDEGRVLAAGQGGAVLYDVTDPTAPLTQGAVSGGSGGPSRYYHAQPIGPGLAWATHRDTGLDLLSFPDPTQPTRIASASGAGFEGLDAEGDHLYVVSTQGHVEVFDARVSASTRSLSAVGRLDGLALPWDIDVVGAVAYVADATEGIVVLSLADPAAPVRVGQVDSGGRPVRLEAVDGHLYVAAGAGGLEIYSLADPLAPTRVATLDPGGGALDVAVHDGRVGVATQEAVVLYDVGRSGSPSSPLPFAYEETAQYAMALDAAGGQWAVGDWNTLGMWAVTDSLAPAADLGVDEVAFLDGAELRTVALTNRGGQDLSLAGITAPAGVSVRVSADRVAPGEVAWLQLQYDGVTPVDGPLCLATDDPGRPQLTLALSTGGEGEGKAIGQQAPDFTLTDLDGGTHRLSEQVGHPVVLAYFATW